MNDPQPSFEEMAEYIEYLETELKRAAATISYLKQISYTALASALLSSSAALGVVYYFRP